MRRVLIIDNFDSFTYNLCDEFEKRNCKVEVYRNNVSLGKLEEIMKEFAPRLIVLSPGPSGPKEAGNCMDIVSRYHRVLPIFGVCLGHQVIVEAFGGVVGKAPETIHGRSSLVYHDGKSIFQGLENPIQVGRYHSLCALKLPGALEETARCGTTNMGVRHREYSVEGIQFHPESVLTPAGGKMIENILQIIKT